MIKDIKDYDKLRTSLMDIGVEFKATAMANNITKLNIIKIDDFRRTTRFLDEEHYTWYTYECKQSRDLKVMAKRLPASVKPEKIIDELRGNGYAIKEATNIIRKSRVENERQQVSVVREPLPMFMLTFEHEEDIEKIRGIKTIQGANVKIEQLRKSRLVPQCRRCQSFGHTQNFCRMKPKCVKCAGEHETQKCKKSSSTKLKCANCSQPHPASYRGCEVAKEAQKMRQRAINIKKPEPRKIKINAPRQEGITYAQTAVRNSDANARQSKVTSEVTESRTTTELLATLVTHLERQGRILEDLSGRLANLERGYCEAPRPFRR